MVSVIVPVYNVASYLGRCIESILAQTYENIELILVDDGSTDNSGAICDEYARKDSRICVIHKKNEGVSSARNDGLLKARGDYLVFVDSDDYVELDCIEQMRQTGGDLCICGFVKHMQDGSLQYHPGPSTRKQNITPNNLKKLMEECHLFTVWGKMFCAKVVRENGIRFRKDMCYGEDSVFAMEYIKHCKTVAFLPNMSYHYIKYPGNSLTQTVSRRGVMSCVAFDEYVGRWLSELQLKSQFFESAAFPTKQKVFWAFCEVLESTRLLSREKLRWYRLFFSLPLFTENMHAVLIHYSPRLRSIIRLRSPHLLLFYQKLGQLGKKK